MVHDERSSPAASPSPAYPVPAYRGTFTEDRSCSLSEGERHPCRMELGPPWDAVFSLAWEAFVHGSTPIGAVVVDPEGLLLGSAVADPARATTTAATDACLLNTRHGPVRHARDKAGDGRRCMVGLIGHLPASRSAIHHSRVRRRYTLQVCRTRNRQGEHNYGCQDQSPAIRSYLRQPSHPDVQFVND